jgi:signal transduction histidine kinase/CheY-like chemotaxis protein
VLTEILPNPTEVQTPPGILFADLEGRAIQVNPRWVEITGCQCIADGEDGWLETVHRDDREWLRGAWLACLRTQNDFSARIRLAGQAEPRLVNLHVASLPSGHGCAAFVVMLDEIGDTHKNEAGILQARKMEAVGRLASGLAHDFANLLTLISGYSEILLGRMGSEPARTEVDEIRKAANRGSDLTRQLLSFSRRHAVEPQIVDVNALVIDMQTMLRRMIGEHIEINTHLSADSGSVKADPGQLEQVIMNLAINSRDAMPRGGKIDIRTRHIYVDRDPGKIGLKTGPYVVLEFADTGHGMDAETLQQAFEPFFTTKDRGHGTGLGLATVYGIVKQGHGDIQVQSEPGRGTTFTICLPRVDAGGQPAVQETTARPAEIGTETILLVEDEDGVRRLLQYVLAKRGYRVIEAAGGPEALSLYEQLGEPVDLLLTDIVMPGMSGRELAQQLRTAQPGLKVIFISGYADEVLAGIGELGPGAAFLPKPLRPDVVAARVRELLDTPFEQGPETSADLVTTGM